MGLVKMNSIHIELQENNGQFAARAIWGMSAWHRDPISAISELFGKALPLIANQQHQAYEGAERMLRSALDPTLQESPK